ncbi:MAG: hemin-degrading factor [Nitratireductor sp.]|nr:hemin-degrading factor [Nitratireductor sp.]
MTDVNLPPRAAKPSPEEIRHARKENPKMRERDLATQLGISEGELVAADCGFTAKRLDLDFDAMFSRMGELGEVMALTRNEHAVHEKIGVYDNFHTGKHAAMFLGDQIDLRLFPVHWKHAFAVEKDDGESVRRSLQFFDGAGEAMHKIHARASTDLAAWQGFVDAFVSDDQVPGLAPEAALAGESDGNGAPETIPVDELRSRWSGMTDTHQFVPLIRKLKLTRHMAVRSVGEDYAWQLDDNGSGGSVGEMLHRAAEEQLPLMCFVGSRGCIQIHSGPIETIRPMGPWLNIMDPTFHLHLRTDRIAESWAVRKPTDKGHVTSYEAYDADGELIIQFFGKRIEGQDEREPWRAIMESLPRLSQSRAA